MNKKVRLLGAAVAILTAGIFLFEDGDKGYDRNWFGLGKDGHYHVTKPNVEHSLEVIFDSVVGEKYEVDVYFDGKLIEKNVSASKKVKHTPSKKGKYTFRFYKIENGNRVQKKPAYKQSGTKTTRNGLRVTTSSSGTVTATVDA